jgi:hypothetical protein
VKTEFEAKISDLEKQIRDFEIEIERLKLSSAVASNEKEEQLRLLQVSDCGPSS